MARPKEFDQEKALRKAIRLFSQQGFAATSTDDLMRVMEVARQSMYDTFGDKRALFLKALELYVTESVHAINVELERPGSALAAVQNALVTFAQRKDLSSAEGCMGLNAISEFGQRDAGVTRITRNAGRRQRQTLMRVLTRAKKQREIRSDADLDSMADFFESTLAGIRMAAKAGKSRHALRNIAAFCVKSVPGIRSPNNSRVTLVLYRRRAFRKKCERARCSGALSIKPLEGSRPWLRRTRALCKFNCGKVRCRDAPKLYGRARQTTAGAE